MELLKDYDICVLYQPKKDNMVADSMSRVYMDNVSHVNKDKMELDRDVHSYPEWVSY